MERIKELLLEDENSSYIDELEYEVNELKKQYDNLKNKDKSKENIDEIKDVIDELDSIIDRIINISSEIQDNLSEYESTSNDLELSIKKYDEALASNQCLIEDGTYQKCELYQGIEDESREDYESEQETIIDLIKDTEEQLEKIEEFKEEVEKFKEEVEQILENEIEEENNTETESKVKQLKNNIVKEESNSEQKGEEGELAFKEWLQKNNFSFLYIKQDKAAFAHMFHNALKRPDFLVLVDGIGLIAIDVKNNKCYHKKYFSLPIERELKRTLAFERTFRLPVWYVYSNCQKYDKWYWINSLKVVEVGKMIVNNSTNKSFYSIPKNDCIEIVTNEDFGKLWTHRFSSLKPINKLDLNN